MMKVSEMIKNLQEFMEEYGDIECWYAKDDEGNGYQEVNFEPSLGFVDTYDDGISEVYSNVEELEEYNLTLEDVTPICIVN